ncbi:MAG: type II secretion system F family protein [Chromatiaceae bacterium]|nr:type II secretion system F family protein [Chromatiaceae bacterium]
MAWLAEWHAWLNDLLADPAAVAWLFVGGLGLLTFIVSFLLLSIFPTLSNPLKGRIRTLVKNDGPSEPKADQLDRAQRLVERLGRGLTPKDATKRERMAAKLIQAGYRSPHALRLFLGSKIAGMGVLLVLAALVILITSPLPPNIAMIYISLALVVGLMGPEMWVNQQLKRRQGAIRQALPDALDLLVVCSEAGLGLNAAIQRVALEIEVQHVDLAQEFKLAMLQMSVGMDTGYALRQMVDRTGLPEMRSLVSTLDQAIRFGTSITSTLRSYSDEMRETRLQRAQEEAAKVGVKMLIPIAVCMLPAILVITIAPIVLKLMGNF